MKTMTVQNKGDCIEYNNPLRVVFEIGCVSPQVWFTLGHMVPIVISPGIVAISVQLRLVIKSSSWPIDGPRNIGSMWGYVDKLLRLTKGSPNHI